jgi:hypothetical protein
VLKRIADGDESWDQMVPPQSSPRRGGLPRLSAAAAFSDTRNIDPRVLPKEGRRLNVSYFILLTAGTYADLINCIAFLGNTSFGLGITCSEGWCGYTGALPGYNTADYYSPATGTTIVAWINYQAKEPVEGVASVMVRDIARMERLG